jgi:hypothetical protein
MRYAVLICLLAGALLAPAFSPAALPDDGLTGTWTGQLVLNSGEADGVTLVIRKGGESPEGTVTDVMGLLPSGTKMESASFRGRELAFKCQAQDTAGPVVVQVRLVLKGAALSGSWEDARNGTSGAVELKRKPKGEYP